MASKLLHTLLYLMAIPCIVVSVIAVFDNHNLRDPPIPNLYSLHSWIGLTAIGLFGLQVRGPWIMDRELDVIYLSEVSTY